MKLQVPLLLNKRLDLRRPGPRIVNYDLADGDQTVYPQLLAPRFGIRITTPVRGKGCKRGPGEEWLGFWIRRHRLKNFYDNQALRIGGHRYEPDLAYIDVERGIFIDIENDEPYTLGRRVPTHIAGHDDQRNHHFTDAGWIVLRFSERQCITSPAGVVRAVMDVVRRIAPDVEMPQALRSVQPVSPDHRWDYPTACRHATSRYRDTYMDGHLPLYRLYRRFFTR
ncbi:MAG: hypothetical protein IJ775_01315 [Muribaculaceae bacterium]|nr:hypothetical protein [Muribaculaceae bacterium]